MKEPLRDLFTSSKQIVLNFNEISEGTLTNENIKLFFDTLEKQGKDPRSSEYRQLFNDRLITDSGYRYLVGLYGEDRSSMLKGSEIENEGRFIHLGVDIFSKDLEDVFAPCEGEIVSIGNEPENHSFGHYLIIRPNDTSSPFIFLGHLSPQIHRKGKVLSGQRIARLGDHLIDHQNGGWSRHLHIQLLNELPRHGVAPLGYIDDLGFKQAAKLYPNPLKYFPDWKIEGL